MTDNKGNRVVVLRKDVQLISMTAGKERKLFRIMDCGEIKEWVGIGWGETGRSCLRDSDGVVPILVDSLVDNDVNFLLLPASLNEDDDMDEPLPAVQCDREGGYCESCQ